MGRIISGASGASASGIGAAIAGAFKVKAGATINTNDLLEFGPDGLAYPAQTVDYAVKSTIGELPFAYTTVAGGQAPVHYERMNLYQAPNGEIYIGESAASGQQMVVYRYSAGGTLIGTLVVDNFASMNYDPHMAVLSNGNIAVTYSNGVDHRYAVITQNLVVVQAATTIAGAHSSQQHSMIGLRGGGFMVCFQDKTSQLLQRIAVFDNAGAVVTAVTTVKAWTGTPNATYCKLVELSNGNVALSCVSNNTLDIGFYVGILSPAGAIVSALTRADTAASSYYPEMHAMDNGYFVAAHYDSTLTTARFRVFNNAGVSQGAFTAGAPQVNSPNTIKIINDGVNFWTCLYGVNGSTSMSLIKFSTAGVILNTYAVGSGVGSSVAYVDMFMERNRIVIVTSTASADPKMHVFNTNTLLMDLVGQAIGLNESTCFRILPGGDFTAIVLGGSSINAIKFCVMKYANTAVVGVSAGAAVAGGLVPISATAGAYVINQLKGAISKTFDHTSGSLSIQGNKGSLLTYGAILKGLV